MSSCHKTYYSINRHVESYINSLAPAEPISIDEENELWRQYKDGDDTILAELCMKYQYIILREVISQYKPHLEIVDLIQEANLGCMIALKNYDYSKGQLKSYLQRNIYRFLQNSINELEDLVRMPANIKEEMYQMRNIISDIYLSVKDDAVNLEIEKHDELNPRLLKLFYDKANNCWMENYIQRFDVDMDNIACCACSFPHPHIKTTKFHFFYDNISYFYTFLNNSSSYMIKSLLAFIISLFKSRTQIQLENLFLKKQLEILSRSNKRSIIKRSDRIFFGLSKRMLNNWKENLVIVKRETVIKWHRQGFKLFWKIKSKHKSGRSRIDIEARKLIIQLAKENQTWGIPRIHGEILKLGFNISQSTVFRYLQDLRRKNQHKTG